MTHRHKSRLSPLEDQVMNVLWERDTATADDVRNAFGKVASDEGFDRAHHFAAAGR